MKISEEKIKFGNTEYSIYLYENFDGFTNELIKIGLATQYIIITEENVSDLYLKPISDELSKLNVPFYVIQIYGGEKNKHIDKVKNVFNRMIELGADRNSVVIALGGGVVGDFSGFIASTFLRGIRFVQVPTTLLACVDSSVGGKVAVNVDKGKNMVGSFHQPSLVFAPLYTLGTLPIKEWKCGLAEVIKHGLLSGGNLFATIKKYKINQIDCNSEPVKDFIIESVKFKSSIVAEDEKETGRRAILNLGHTMGHAIESYTQYKKLSHGEAVAIGLVTSLFLSKKYLELNDSIILQCIELLKQYQLSYKIDLPSDKLVEHMLHDKKTSGSEIKYVLLKNIGDSVWGVKVEKEDIINAFEMQKQLD